MPTTFFALLANDGLTIFGERLAGAAFLAGAFLAIFLAGAFLATFLEIFLTTFFAGFFAAFFVTFLAAIFFATDPPVC